MAKRSKSGAPAVTPKAGKPSSLLDTRVATTIPRSIDWHQIRPIRGHQQAGFEELCCQLARREEVPGRVGELVRKGTPDSGVECFWVCADKSEVGWQAKFFPSRPTASQWQQVDDSVTEALQGHPKLVRYIICIPIDRSDGREAGKKSLLEQWNDRCRKWKLLAGRKRKIEFEFWGSSELVDRLSGPKAAGLYSFWFGADELGADWFERHVGDQVRNAGPRYTREVNVEVPIVSRIGWILRAPKAVNELRLICAEAVKSIRRFVLTGQRQLPDVDGTEISKCADALADLAVSTPSDPAEGLRLSAITDECDRATALIRTFRNRARTDEKAKDWKEPQRSYNRYDGHPFADVLYDADTAGGKISSLSYLAASDAARLADHPFLLITGKAGSGKTHLLCAAAERQVQAGLPAVLLLGERFNGTNDPWTQINQMLGLKCSSGDELLALLEAAAETSGARFLFLLDAINEGPGVEFWKKHLPGMRAAFERHRRIALVVTVRDPYAIALFGDDINGWPMHASHDGFVDVLEDACDRFFAYYGLDAPNIPTLQAEFENPLFLTLFCKAIKNSGFRQAPIGVNGISLLLDFFLKSLRAKLFGRDWVLDDPRGEKVQRIVNAIADGLKTKALITEKEALHRIRAATATPDPLSHFRTLLDEGILRRTARYDHQSKSFHEGVDFGYERLLHHLVARSLLKDVGLQRGRLSKKHIDRIRAFFGKNHRDVSRLEALQVEFSETTGQELQSIIRTAQWTGAADRAFRQSLASRSPSAVTLRAVAIAEKAVARDRLSFQSLVPTLLDVSYRPGHPLNASFLHGVLWPMSLAERDEWWTTFIHHEFDWNRGVSPDRIVRWLWRSDSADHISDESADLAATTVAWFLTSSNRFLRDRATKALVRLLSVRLPLASSLVTRFADVNDPYVLERVLAATYGAVLRSSDSAAVRLVAQTVSAVIFKPPVRPHALIRHYAASVVEIAVARHGLTGVDLRAMVAPLGSAWLEPPTMAKLEPLFNSRRATLGSEASTILYSVDHHGDFGHYALHLSDWSSVRRNEEEFPRNRSDGCAEVDKFASTLTKPQLSALETYVQTARSVESRTAEYEALKPALENVTKKLRGTRHQVFGSRIVPLITDLLRGFEELPSPEFPKELLQRFILSWIANSGWTSERFGEFDSSVRGAGRESHKAERIGKKYQWIAYHEGLARISDNFRMKADASYREWLLDLRDIDPGLLLWAMPTSDSERPSFTWWSPDPGTNLELDQPVKKWLRSTDSIPGPEKLLHVLEPVSGRRLFVLNSNNDIRERPALGDEFRDRQLRRVWWFVDCFLVRKKDWPTVKRWGAKRKADYFDRETNHTFYDPSIAEYPDAPLFRDSTTYYAERHEWARRDDTTHEFLLTSDEYSCSNSGLDCSVETQINVTLPAPKLAEMLNLRHLKRDGEWTDPDGRVLCFDPAPRVPGENALLIDANAFEKALQANDLVPYWLVRGEKETWGGTDRDWPGQFLYHYFCWIDRGKLRYRLSTSLKTRHTPKKKRRAAASVSEAIESFL